MSDGWLTCPVCGSKRPSDQMKLVKFLLLEELCCADATTCLARVAERMKRVKEIESFSNMPRVLRAARIDAGLSQRALAEKLGIHEQQIQRYEATEYASASFKRLQEVGRVLQEALSEATVRPVTPREEQEAVFGRLRAVGVRLHQKLHGPTDAAEVLWVPDEVVDTLEGYIVTMINGACEPVEYVHLDLDENIIKRVPA